MKIIYLYSAILFLATIFNCYTDFGFSLVSKSEKITLLWFFLYNIILPIKLMSFVYGKYKVSSNFYRYSFFAALAYMFSVLVSGISFFDFRKFILLGDGETKYVLGVIYFISFVSIVSSFLFFQVKNRIKKTYEN
ncbi:hypothetical protein [Flavobacterium quisquiliarum]|jgi:hypothetical protein|uniref:Uncharacterized protein n=1 Tax=Flavobacterium quisquiliarum TaxID=1834436 RepID=A0ABV8W8A8_9FLAO|nr:hypothetical protein [Flavobacterium quisquiliarum]MBW1654406.1 hypothetical protein [Flavobacterium quisquiliarum]NWL01162.1 hypothetical protein [Flavobacterium collinsii]